jgi:hypothetical protein
VGVGEVGEPGLGIVEGAVIDEGESLPRGRIREACGRHISREGRRGEKRRQGEDARRAAEGPHAAVP